MEIIKNMLAISSSRPASEQVVLSAERRLFLKRRWRGTAADGVDFGFDLETRLIDGCLIFQTAEIDYIVVQIPEKVYEIPLGNLAEATQIGWKVGNLHLPAQILTHCIRVLHDDAMTQLLTREGWAFSEPEVVFTPMKVMVHS
jgi:urease accessory protein